MHLLHKHDILYERNRLYVRNGMNIIYVRIGCTRINLNFNDRIHNILLIIVVCLFLGTESRLRIKTKTDALVEINDRGA